MKKLLVIALGVVFSITGLVAQNQVKLPALIGDQMVLQQNFKAPLWGWSNPGETIKVTTSWNEKTYYALTDIAGKWKVNVETPSAGGPYEIAIGDQLVKSVLIGEVWLASGQSNMQWALNRTEKFEAELLLAEDDQLRLFYVARDNADVPLVQLPIITVRNCELN